MDVDLEGLVILTNDQAVADAVQIGTQAVQGLVGGLADDEHGVEGEGNVLVADGGEVRLLLGSIGHLRHGLTPQGAEHTLQNDEVALAAGVHYAGLFQHGVHLDGLRQGGVAGLDGLVQYELGVVLLAGGLQRTLGGQAGDGEDRALGGLHHRAVGSGNALLHGLGQQGAVGGVMALEDLAHAAEQQGQNDAGVAPGTPEQAGGRQLGGLVHGGGLGLAELVHRRLDGQGHIGAGVAVGHRKYVQVVDGLFLRGDAGGAEGDHLLEGAAADLFCHVCSPSGRVTR